MITCTSARIQMIFKLLSYFSVGLSCDSEVQNSYVFLNIYLTEIFICSENSVSSECWMKANQRTLSIICMFVWSMCSFKLTTLFLCLELMVLHVLHRVPLKWRLINYVLHFCSILNHIHFPQHYFFSWDLQLARVLVKLLNTHYDETIRRCTKELKSYYYELSKGFQLLHLYQCL